MTTPDRELAAALRDNIARLTERQSDEAAAAPWSQRISALITDFAGSMRFVLLHLIVFGGWIVINLGAVPPLPRFDPSFVVLAMVASVEAIFLSTFVLITQNRMAVAADRRADLDLHVNLLAEHELTRLAGLIERMANRLGIEVDDPQFAEIRKDIDPTQVLDALDTERRGADSVA